MYKIINHEKKVYQLYTYEKEMDFERMIVSNIDMIFGEDGVYFDIKKRIGQTRKGATIPDGYYLDLTFHQAPCLYLVEVELNTHDVYSHIGEQILRFGIASENDKYNIKNLLLHEIEKDVHKKKTLENYLESSQFNNINELLDKVIFDNAPAVIVMIDKATEELYKVMAQLTIKTEIIEIESYQCGSHLLHRFTPFKDDILEDINKNIDVDSLNTIIVPAREDGFQTQFINNERWFAIRISAAMIDKIKYIAAYQVSPISAITYVAEVDRIEKYEDTNKYIVYFKPNTIKRINKIELGNKKGLAPQSPRYCSFEMLLKAKTLDDIWG